MIPIAKHKEVKTTFMIHDKSLSQIMSNEIFHRSKEKNAFEPERQSCNSLIEQEGEKS